MIGLCHPKDDKARREYPGQAKRDKEDQVPDGRGADQKPFIKPHADDRPDDERENGENSSNGFTLALCHGAFLPAALGVIVLGALSG